MEKILITGAAGFLGRQLSDFLEKKKIQTVDVDDLSVRPLLKPKKKLIKMKVENISEGFLKKKSILLGIRENEDSIQRNSSAVQDSMS